MNSYHQSFVDEVETFIRDNGITPTGFGKAALDDPSFVFDLRAGRSPSSKVMDRVRDWMRTNARKSKASAKPRPLRRAAN